MNEEDIIDSIQRMRWQHIQNGGEPKKITMSAKTFNEIVHKVRQVVCMNTDDGIKHKVCGMEIEIRKDMNPDVMFIVS